ncbi:TPA: hypothetical protein ACKPZV_000190 [Stenotrophomonas maltophilia]
MTTDNKTLAVGALAAWAEMADSIANRRDECLGRGQFIQAEIYREMLAKHSRSMITVAELIEATSLLSAQLLLHGDLEDGAFYYNGYSAPELQTPMADVEAALARVKGESA